ncbi:enoyl-CoA hydratase family protein [Sporichthya brevicatena]|uniref:Enoyl-CoA hydratase family protein n=1 Tax=Sporichthya brevicatena TaxID=171442 RepID=A0ABN1GYK2_9ACTN
MSGGVRSEVRGGVATLTLDEPDNRNALSESLVNGLGDGLARACADESVRVIVLTNTGSTFCAGADLRGGGGAPRWSPTEIYQLILDAPKPVVGRIAGHCLGGGVGLAAACDISVVSAEARFGFSEVRLGVAPAIISVIVLPKLGRAVAAELMLTGRRIGGAEAASTGLVNRAVPMDQLDAEVAGLLAELLAGGPQAQMQIKTLIRRVPQLERDAAFAEMTVLSRQMFGSAEAAEGVAAFRDRRPAAWAAEGENRAARVHA